MLARSGDVPEDDRWVLELKFDGCRGQLRVDRGKWTLRSPPGRDITDRLPELAVLAEGLSRHRVILDGEVVCFGADGTRTLTRCDPVGPDARGRRRSSRSSTCAP